MSRKQKLIYLDLINNIKVIYVYFWVFRVSVSAKMQLLSHLMFFGLAVANAADLLYWIFF